MSSCCSVQSQRFKSVTAGESAAAGESKMIQNVFYLKVTWMCCGQ